MGILKIAKYNQGMTEAVYQYLRKALENYDTEIIDGYCQRICNICQSLEETDAVIGQCCDLSSTSSLFKQRTLDFRMELNQRINAIELTMFNMDKGTSTCEDYFTRLDGVDYYGLNQTSDLSSPPRINSPYDYANYLKKQGKDKEYASIMALIASGGKSVKKAHDDKRDENTGAEKTKNGVKVPLPLPIPAPVPGTKEGNTYSPVVDDYSYFDEYEGEDSEIVDNGDEENLHPADNPGEEGDETLSPDDNPNEEGDETLSPDDNPGEEGEEDSNPDDNPNEEDDEKPHNEDKISEKEEELLHKERELSDRETALDTREKQLDNKEKGLNDREKELDQREMELQEREEKLMSNNDSINPASTHNNQNAEQTVNTNPPKAEPAAQMNNSQPNNSYQNNNGQVANDVSQNTTVTPTAPVNNNSNASQTPPPSQKPIVDDSEIGNTQDLFENNSGDNKGGAGVITDLPNTNSGSQSTKSSKGFNPVPLAVGLGAAVAGGVGVKAYMNHRENSQFDDTNEDSFTNGNRFWSEDDPNVINTEQNELSGEDLLKEQATSPSYSAISNGNNDTWSIDENSQDSSADNSTFDLLGNN